MASGFRPWLWNRLRKASQDDTDPEELKQINLKAWKCDFHYCRKLVKNRKLTHLYIICVNVCSVVPNSLWNYMDCSPPGPSVHEIFSRQEYWSGLSFTSSGDLPDPGIETAFPASSALAGGFFTTEPPGKSLILCKYFTVSLRWLTGFKDKQMLVQPTKGHWHYLKLQHGIWLVLLNCPINSRGVLQAKGSWFGSKHIFLKPLLHCSQCITNILS